MKVLFLGLLIGVLIGVLPLNSYAAQEGAPISSIYSSIIDPGQSNVKSLIELFNHADHEMRASSKDSMEFSVVSTADSNRQEFAGTLNDTSIIQDNGPWCIDRVLTIKGTILKLSAAKTIYSIDEVSVVNGKQYRCV